jgi:PadR family transcriptional regulator AphA
VKYRVIEKNKQKYIDVTSTELCVQREGDIMDLIAACGENNTSRLLLHDKALPDGFFDLKTGLAGQVLQKLINYHVKTALIISNEQRIQGRFKELLIESNRGNDFRVFTNISDAEKWLLN